jgi:hypothetical protein
MDGRWARNPDFTKHLSCSILRLLQLVLRATVLLTSLPQLEHLRFAMHAAGATVAQEESFTLASPMAYRI